MYRYHKEEEDDDQQHQQQDLSDDEVDLSLMEDVRLSSSNNNTTPSTPNTNEFIQQMEELFKSIDVDDSGIITLDQLRNEIESLIPDIEQNNPLISKLLTFLNIVHSNQSNLMNSSGGLGNSMDGGNEDQDESNIKIDIQSFLQSMTWYMDGMDPKEARRQRLEKQRLPKFKVPVDLLKKFNITPRLSPLVSGSGSGSAGTGSPQFSHIAGHSPSKNKFGRLFTSKPVVSFDQFNDLITKLNYGREIPHQKLMMFLNDLPRDNDECIDANLFLSRFGGLNHPMSPKLTYEGNSGEKEHDDDFRIESSVSSPNSSFSQWNRNSQIVDQLQESYKSLEKECETFQTEISILEKTRQNLEINLKKKDQENDRLRKDARFVDGMRDANKDLIVQNTNLKTQISKLSQNEELLRESIDQEKEKARALNENVVFKDLEIKKLKLLLKNQQNINNKLSMMVTFSSPNDETDKNIDKSGTFTVRRTKPVVDSSKPVLSKQKSEKYSTIGPNSNLAQLFQQYKQEKQQLQQLQQQQQDENKPMAQSLESEFEELNRSQNYSSVGSNSPMYTSYEDEGELSSLKDQLNSSNIILPNDESFEFQNSPQKIQDNQSSPIFTSTQQPSLDQIIINSPSNNDNNNSNNNNSQYNSQHNSVIASPQQNTHVVSTPIVTPPLVSSATSLPTSRSISSPNYIRTSSPSLKSPHSVSSSPGPNVAPLSPFNLVSQQQIFKQQQSVQQQKSQSLQPFSLQQQQSTLSGSDLEQLQSNLNIGSMRRLKKQDIIRLHTFEMEEQNENTQNLINEQTAAFEEFKKQASAELSRYQKLYQEERQTSKMLEKQLALQMDKNKEMVAGKDNSHSTATGTQSFFSFLSNFLPSTLFCNLSNTS
ncbi:hypothetical protein CYY_003998 [Polysphondylium violaceum]|uniref:EF-hand domain-containing protein n=1 Tax=Polysphondylium violaceum TaxID=133409 RepID=A0A8J4V860_9MYCE|nr:hypothetical protein CYY_003998 [Polysphondylium violaceum]